MTTQHRVGAKIVRLIWLICLSARKTRMPRRDGGVTCTMLIHELLSLGSKILSCREPCADFLDWKGYVGSDHNILRRAT